MTIVNIDLRNQGYETGPDDRVIFYSLLVREGDFGTISTAPVEVRLTDGKATIDLAPGPVGVQIIAGQIVDTRVKIGEVPPSGPTTLNAVMMVTPAYTPALQAAMIAAIERARDEALGEVSTAVDTAINTRLDGKADKTHTHTSASITDASSIISTSNTSRAGKLVKLNDSGKLEIGSGSVTGPTDPVNKAYVDTEVGKKANSTHQHNGTDILSGTTSYIAYTGDLRFAKHLVRLNDAGKLHVNTAGITLDSDVTNKSYVDASIATAISTAVPNTDSRTTMWWN